MSAEEVCDPRRHMRDEAIRAARRYQEERVSYDVEIVRFFSQHLSSARIDMDVVERALDVLAAVAQPARLHGAIRLAFAHEDGRVRSKAAVAVGHCVADLPLLNRLLADPDARVRANTIEALWHLQTPDIESVFLRALSDSSHRAVANAAYGLYLIDETKYFDKIAGLLEHPHSGYRAAGAWLLGKIGDPKHLPLLRSLLLEKSSDVRSAAFRTLKILRAADTRPASALQPAV